MNFENIVKLQEMFKVSLDEAKSFDAKGVHFSDEDINEVFSIYFEEKEEEEQAEAERLADLEERGFYFGTDDPYRIQQIEDQEAFNDRLTMYQNEY